MSSVTDLHPPAVQIFQLWQIYLDNVNPLLKVTHTPTLQGQLIEAAANPSKMSKPLEALLFSIYYIAVMSLTDEQVRDTFKEEKSRLMSKYHRGTQQALVNAGFMRTSDLVVLQAFLLYLVSQKFSAFSHQENLPTCSPLAQESYYWAAQIADRARLPYGNSSTHEPISV